MIDLGSALKRSNGPMIHEQPLLPPPSSVMTATLPTVNIGSIKTNRLFKIEALNPFQNR